MAAEDPEFLFLSLTYYLIFASDQRAAHSMLFWTLGGLGLANSDVTPRRQPG